MMMVIVTRGVMELFLYLQDTFFKISTNPLRPFWHTRSSVGMQPGSQAVWSLFCSSIAADILHFIYSGVPAHLLCAI